MQFSPHLSPRVHILCVFTGPTVRVLSLRDRFAQDGEDPCNLNPSNTQVQTRYASAPGVIRHATRGTQRLNQQHATNSAMHTGSHLTQIPLPPVDIPPLRNLPPIIPRDTPEQTREVQKRICFSSRHTRPQKYNTKQIATTTVVSESDPRNKWET